MTSRPSKAPPKTKPRKKEKGREEMTDALRAALRDIIYRSVMGKSKLWPIDPKYPADGSLKDRFNGTLNKGAGDKQILLWAIDDCAKKREPIPDWAANALHDLIYRAAEGEFHSWDDAFGKIFAAGKRKNRIEHLALMLRVWARICHRHKAGESKSEELFVSVGEEFKIGATLVKDLYGQVEDAIKSGDWVPDRSLIASENAPLSDVNGK
jgi:hypothetical protein